jgi:hypothetical protein
MCLAVEERALFRHTRAIRVFDPILNVDLERRLHLLKVRALAERVICGVDVDEK